MTPFVSLYISIGGRHVTAQKQLRSTVMQAPVPTSVAPVRAVKMAGRSRAPVASSGVGKFKSSRVAQQVSGSTSTTRKIGEIGKVKVAVSGTLNAPNPIYGRQVSLQVRITGMVLVPPVVTPPTSS